MQRTGKLSLPFTVASRGVVPALPTLSRVGVTEVGVAVALAGAAAGEAPLAGRAVGAAAAHGSGFAAALACGRFALLLHRALWVAVARWWRDHTDHRSSLHQHALPVTSTHMSNGGSQEGAMGTPRPQPRSRWLVSGCSCAPKTHRCSR